MVAFPPFKCFLFVLFPASSNISVVLFKHLQIFWFLYFLCIFYILCHMSRVFMGFCSFSLSCFPPSSVYFPASGCLLVFVIVQYFLFYVVLLLLLVVVWPLYVLCLEPLTCFLVSSDSFPASLSCFSASSGCSIISCSLSGLLAF